MNPAKGSIFGELFFKKPHNSQGDTISWRTLDYGDKIGWYENIDGTGSFGPKQIISNNSQPASRIFATDLDGDGDTDVLFANSRKIGWHENIDGAGNFGRQQIISMATRPRDIIAVDVDGDGDMDVLSANNRIAWFENRSPAQHPTDTSVQDAPVESPVKVREFEVDGRVLAFSPNGSNAIVAGREGQMLLWDVEAGKKTRGLGEGWGATAFSSDGRLAVGKNGLVDIETGEIVRQDTFGPGSVFSFSADGNQLLSFRINYARSGAGIWLWDASTGELTAETMIGQKDPWCAALSPDGKHVAVGLEKNGMRIWEPRTDQHVSLMNRPGVSAVDFSHDNELVAGATTDGTIFVYRVQSGQEVRRFGAPELYSFFLDFEAEGKHIASFGNAPSANGSVLTVRVWDLDSGELVYRFDHHGLGFQAGVFSTDGRKVLCAGYGTKVAVHSWNE